MVYSPRFSEIFESVLPDNILAIVERDFKGALDAFYVSENLPDFVQRTVGNFIRVSLPALAVEPDRGADNESDDSSHLEPQVRVTIYLAVEDADPTETLRKLIKYVRALRSVLKTASNADYVAGISSNTVMGIVRELSWQYGEIGKDADRGMWMMPATFELTLRYTER